MGLTDCKRWQIWILSQITCAVVHWKFIFLKILNQCTDYLSSRKQKRIAYLSKKMKAARWFFSQNALKPKLSLECIPLFHIFHCIQFLKLSLTSVSKWKCEACFTRYVASYGRCSANVQINDKWFWTYWGFHCIMVFMKFRSMNLLITLSYWIWILRSDIKYYPLI